MSSRRGSEAEILTTAEAFWRTAPLPKPSIPTSPTRVLTPTGRSSTPAGIAAIMSTRISQNHSAKRKSSASASTTRANVHVTNEAGYVQETLSFWNGRLILGGGLRYDEFRYGVED